MSRTDSAICAKLADGDRRSIGRSEEVVAEVLRDPAKFGDLFAAISSDDPVVRMRAADAAEKVTALHPVLLRPYKRQLLSEVAAIEQQEVRWHVAQMLPRLSLSAAERRQALQILVRCLDDDSRIVKTFVMQALTDFAKRDRALLPAVLPRCPS